MQSAGLAETRSHPPLQNSAKADNPKRWKPARQPAGWQAWCIQHVTAFLFFQSIGSQALLSMGVLF
jgi:hypothetical protein